LSLSSLLCATMAPSFLTLFTPKKEEAERHYFNTSIVVSSFYVTNDRKEACI
jgi:hypothetical protein